MIDWHASGLIVRPEFNLVDSRTLDDLGPLEGVTSYSLAESWRGKYRQTGSVELDGAELPAWAAVRAFVVASDGTESQRVELATLYPYAAPETQTRYGRDMNKYDLASMMRKLGDNLNDKDTAIGAGWSAAGHFSWCCTECGAVPGVHPGIDSTTKSPRVWEAGETYLTEAHAMADACGGRVEPDAHGRVCLVPYQYPAKVAQSFELQPGAGSVVHVGLDYERPEIINKVVAVYEQGDDRRSVVATVPVSHPWHYSRIGRWAAVEVRPSQVADGADITAVLRALASQTLNERADVRGVYSIEAAFEPIRVGQAGTLYYSDAPGMAPRIVSGFVSGREVKWDGAGVSMSLTIEEV